MLQAGVEGQVSCVPVDILLPMSGCLLDYANWAFSAQTADSPPFEWAVADSEDSSDGLASIPSASDTYALGLIMDSSDPMNLVPCPGKQPRASDQKGSSRVGGVTVWLQH